MEAISTTRNIGSRDLITPSIAPSQPVESRDTTLPPQKSPDDVISELSTLKYRHFSPEQLSSTQTEVLAVLLAHPLPSLTHISPVFANLTGINILLATIRLLKNDSNEYTQAKMENLGEVLSSVIGLNEFKFDANSSSAYNREVLSLLCGSRLFNGLTEFQWDIEQYLKWLGHVITDKNTHASRELTGLLIISALKLHSNSDIICSMIYSSAYIKTLVDVSNYMKPFQMKQSLSFSINYLSSTFTEDSQVSPLAQLLSLLNIPVVDLFRQTSSVSQLNLVKSLLISASRDVELFQEQVLSLLQLWGSKLNISKSPVAMQRHQTEVLFVSLSLLTKPFLQQLTIMPAFLDGITNHLSSPSTRVRDFGILIGEKIAQYGTTPLSFGIESSEDWSGLSVDKLADSSLDLLFDADMADPEVSIPASPPQSIFSDVLSDRGSVSKGQGRYRKLDFNIRSHTKDSDDEDSDDEDPSNKTVSKPVYISQLLEYFKAPEGDDQFEKLDIALKSAPGLIMEKSKYGNEVKMHAKTLAKVLVQFKDNFDFADYHKLRTQALVVLVGTQPDLAPYIVELFYTADITINDRLLLLTSLSLGARWVNGFTDTVDVKPVVMKKLPAAVEQRFSDMSIAPNRSLSGSNSLLVTDANLNNTPNNSLTGDVNLAVTTTQPLDSVTGDLQKTLLSPTINESRDSELLHGPKVLRVSSTLQKQRLGQPNTTITTNHFSKVAHLFIFPLIDNWWKAGTGIMAGSFSSIIQAHYFKTLGLLLYTAAPSAPKLTEMTSELLAMMLKLRSYVYIDDPQVIEAACTCILVVLDTHSDEYIVQKWPREFIDLQKWLEDTWEGIIDERVKGVAAGVLYQMKKLAEKWQRSLIGV